MRILYPYVTSFPEAVAALPAGAERIHLAAWDVEAYWRLLREAWQSGEDFLIIEQDMVLPVGTVAGFEACPREWCGLPDAMPAAPAPTEPAGRNQGPPLGVARLSVDQSPPPRRLE